MLKAQLRSKIFQIDPGWRDIEDILTGDYFGLLDYLPRKPFLADFVAYVASLNPDGRAPATTDVDWECSQMLFWPRIHAKDERAEPDVVIVTDKWVLVIEVKLGSGLGDRQPWREFIVGKRIAEDYGLYGDCVYYLVVAPTRLDIAPMFEPSEAEKLDVLARRTSYVKWHEIVALVESWLRGCPNEKAFASEHERILGDLLAALRKRRSIAFSGFSFAHLGPVGRVTAGFFCPPAFTGFLGESPGVRASHESLLLCGLQVGFGTPFPLVDTPGDHVFLSIRFGGFAANAPNVPAKQRSFFCGPRFGGFLKAAPTCVKYPNLILRGITDGGG
jgi:hypothetical protein